MSWTEEALWILVSGTWDDDGEWDDDALWIDELWTLVASGDPTDDV